MNKEYIILPPYEPPSKAMVELEKAQLDCLNDIYDSVLQEEIGWFRMASKLPNTDKDKLAKWEQSIDDRAIKVGLEDWKE